ncbi:N-acetylneuraminate synthase [Chitinophaga alhagiae]|uniref:N-acetylneuraminate synthase n=1 Tax=Chitinophaga alhagiae TaxID=2203219 RepID=A0ABM6WBC3_9BACT|nr:acetyltransferase [Chitinophaga alhagiae]AWO01185.1 N-acetylneuraminate synthase [Chitinophaga alhagiae]
MQSVILIGYSGHAYSVINIFTADRWLLAGYMDDEEKKANPFDLSYLGSEKNVETLRWHRDTLFFVAVGNNHARRKITQFLQENRILIANAVHPSASVNGIVAANAGVMIGINAAVNALAEIHEGVICNTGCVIEHECIINKFAHIAPGAVLAGNVSIGEETFIGANAVIRQGVTIGRNVTVGAGSVIIHDIPDNMVVAGNPGRPLNKTSN